MMAAARRVAGDAGFERQARGANGAAGRGAGAAHHRLVHRQADLALDGGRQRERKHLIDIGGVMGKRKLGGARRLGLNEAMRREAGFAEHFGETAIFAHREAMLRGNLGRIGGVVNDRQRHGGEG